MNESLVEVETFSLVLKYGANENFKKMHAHNFYKRTESGSSQFGSSREQNAAAHAANVQYAGQQRVIIIITRQPTLGPGD